MIRFWAGYAGVLVAVLLAWPSAAHAMHWVGPEHGVCEPRSVLEARLTDQGQRRVGFGVVPNEVGGIFRGAIYRLDLWGERDDFVFTWVMDIDAEMCVIPCLPCMLTSWGLPQTSWVVVPWRP